MGCFCLCGANVAQNGKTKTPIISLSNHWSLYVLSHQDSNLDKQNQNLLCCHYTMRQCVILLEKRGKDRKICLKFYVWRSEKCRIFAIIILRLVENSSFCLVG